MRDINRIQIVLDTLHDIWIKYPDLRFGQLIENIMIHHEKNHIGVCGVENNLWNWEEEKWLKAMREYNDKKWQSV